MYEIDLEVEEGEPELKVLDYHIQGKCDLDFVFVAHLDHPGMANDDMAGCAVGVELFKALSSRNMKFSYRLLLVQEIIGSQYYLNRYPKGRVAEGLFLDMLGVDVPLTVQQSFMGSSMIESAFKQISQQNGIKVQFAGFRELAGNDEIVFETHGIPMASLIRFPYPEYHCNLDNISIINNERLDEAVKLLSGVINRLEEEIYIKKGFDGLLCLSNPDYTLYVEPGQPSFGEGGSGPLRNLMEHMSLIGQGEFLVRLCSASGVDKDDAFHYLKLWENRGLLELI